MISKQVIRDDDGRMALSLSLLYEIDQEQIHIFSGRGDHPLLTVFRKRLTCPPLLGKITVKKEPDSFQRLMRHEELEGSSQLLGFGEARKIQTEATLGNIPAVQSHVQDSFSSEARTRDRS